MIREKAHLFTLLAAVWTVFTLLGVFFFREYGETGVGVAITIWILHTAFITLSIYFWITEQPKPVLIDEGDRNQENVSPFQKRKRTFGSRLIFSVVGAFFAMFAYIAIQGGKIRVGRGEPPHYIISSEEPIRFWTYVIVFSMLSAIAFYCAFAKGKNSQH